MLLGWLIKSLKNKIDIASNRDESKENEYESPDVNTENKGLKAWTYNFSPQSAKNDNIDYSNSIVNVNKHTEESSWRLIFGSKKVSDKKLSKGDNLENSDESLTTFQRKLAKAKKEIIASSVASVISTFASHPFDVIKSHYLSLRYPRGQLEPPRRPNMFYLVKSILKVKGWKRFYRDHWSSQASSLSQTIFIFWTYEEVYEALMRVEELKNCYNLINFVAGFASATIPVVAIHPIYVLWKQQNIKKRFHQMCGPWAVKSLNHNVNFFRLYFGGCLSLYLHLGTLYGLRFLFFGLIYKNMMLHSSQNNASSVDSESLRFGSENELSNLHTATAGALAGVLSDLLAYPLDVIHFRTRMSALRRQQYKFDRTHHRLKQSIKMILKNEGILAFYSGLWPSMLKSTVNMAVQFTVYDEMKYCLNPLFPT